MVIIMEKCYLKILFIIISILFACTAAGAEDSQWQSVPGHKFKKISKNGYCNCIFSNEEIPKHGEAGIQIKKSFMKPEQVFARCYFPKSIGQIPAENFWHELRIDGNLVRVTEFEEPPTPDWDQTAVWITSEDYPKVMKEMGQGRRQVELRIMKKTMMGKPVILSRGWFAYTVPENQGASN